MTHYLVKRPALDSSQSTGWGAEALEEALVGLGRLAVAIVRVGVVVTAVPVLSYRQLPRRYDDPRAGSRRPQREAGLHVGVAVEARLRVRHVRRQRGRPAHRHQVAEHRIDVTRTRIG